jgi:Tol biopolymer transport system component
VLSRRLHLFVLLLAVLAIQPPILAQSSEADGEAVFLSRVRRLTYEGLRAGEGYFSPDGSQMVLQSEREEGNPFYQIYLMDMTTGDSVLVSPGMGKTTCAFIRPGTGEIEFASTHHDPMTQTYADDEYAARETGQERRYAWDYDPAMEIYVTNPANGDLTRLTDAEGYDAEGSYSPDGEWIVFASNRQAYERELSAEDARLLEIDQSYFIDIHLMRADGSEVRQLTKTPGYDGGPFFFPDGSRIIWRRFDESGLIADVWSMLPDGTDQRQLTDFGAMSWAPYVHPSGEYIVFASNKLGFTNFEVFMVDVEGTREPVQITFADGFDGLPVPTPSGDQMVWTSQRHNGDGAQLFIGEWNHEAALAALAAAPPRTAHSES